MDANFTPANIVSGPAGRKHYLGEERRAHGGAGGVPPAPAPGGPQRNTDSPTEKLLRREAGSIR